MNDNEIDEYSGIGGSYYRDPVTGKRKPIAEAEIANGIAQAEAPKLEVIDKPLPTSTK